MRDDFGIPRHVFDAARVARERLGHFGVLEAQIRAWQENPIHRLAEQVRRDEERHAAFARNAGLLERFESLSEQMRIGRGLGWESRLGIDAGVFERIQQTAKMAQSLELPSALDRFRTSPELLSAKLLHLPDFDWMRRPGYMDAFNRASALSDLVGQSVGVRLELREAALAFSAGGIPSFESLAGYRQFLDAAGLSLSRWPKLRLLTAAEKRRRFKTNLKRKTEPPHVKRAKSLVHRYELTLREILDAVMADTYGEEWAEQRLPLCDCKDLLGKWRKRGGEVLDHADYAHYERIMGHPEHFEAVFEAGFDDPQALAELMRRAGRLRAASHHGREFTPEDLRDLRVTWLTIESGLLAFTPDYEVESWG